jgi:calcium-dependent protein kinase
VKKGFRHDNNITYINENQIHELFEKFGSSTSGEINYSEFLAATVDRQRALTKENLRFAFHYFDTDNEGYITKDDLKEVFRRQGTSISDEFLNKIIS